MKNTIRITAQHTSLTPLREQVTALAKKIPAGEAMTQSEVAKIVDSTSRSGGCLSYAIRDSGCAIYLMLSGHKVLCLGHPQTARKYAQHNSAR